MGYHKLGYLEIILKYGGEAAMWGTSSINIGGQVRRLTTQRSRKIVATIRRMGDHRRWDAEGLADIKGRRRDWSPDADINLEELSTRL